MTAYTIIAGQLIKIGVTASGTRIVPKAVYQKFPGMRKHESKQHFERLRVAKLEVK